MIVKITADQVTQGLDVEVEGDAAVLAPVRSGSVTATDRVVGITVGRGLRIVIDARSSQIEVPVIGFQGPPGPTEVFIDETPAIDYPALSFTEVPGVTGLHDMQVNAP